MRADTGNDKSSSSNTSRFMYFYFRFVTFISSTKGAGVVFGKEEFIYPSISANVNRLFIYFFFVIDATKIPLPWE